MSERTPQEWYQRGLQFLGRDGIEQDYDEAFLCFNKAAELPEALHSLAVMYLFGEGRDPDTPKAKEYFKKAGSMDYAPSLHSLGALFFEEQQYEVAITYFEKAASLGLMDSISNLYLLYFFGKDIPKDRAKGVRYARQGMELGDERLAFDYAMILMEEGDVSLGLQHLQNLAEKNNVKALRQLGYYYLEGGVVEPSESKALEYLLVSSELGDDESSYQCALLYRNGSGVEPSEEASFLYLKKAADQGNVHAKLSLREWYLNGIGTEKSEENAFFWTKRAAEEGLGDAQYLLGLSYAEGMGVEPDQEVAFSWFQKAAGQGIEEAIYRVAKCYMDGVGVEEDVEEGLKQLQALASLESPSALLLLGQFHISESYDICEPEEGFKYVIRAKDAGSIPALQQLGVCYIQGMGCERDIELGFQYFSRAAEEGVAEAMMSLSICYEEGLGTSVSPLEAFEWCKRGALANYPDAMFRLAMMYFEGRGVDVDYIACREWLLKSDTAGAHEQLGILYLEGLGTDASPEKAFHEFRVATDLGSWSATLQVALMYQDGIGCEKDMDQVFHWMEIAADGGLSEAQYRLGLLLLPNHVNEAVEWLIRAADQNHTLACFEAAKLLLEGTLTPPNRSQAVKYILRSGKAGHWESYLMGARFFREYKVPDYELSVSLYESAIENGCMEAKTELKEIEDAPVHELIRCDTEILGELALRYLEGKAFAKNVSKGVELLQELTKREYPDAFYRLGVLYEEGDPLEQDEIKALELWEKAAAMGHTKALQCVANSQDVNRDRSLECSICFAPLLRMGAAPLACGHHQFHIDCIHSWFHAKDEEASPQKSCPICRSVVQ
jgi:TPR repeat protein